MKMVRFFFMLQLLFVGGAILAQATTDFIHIDQFGYRLYDQKIAVISDPQTGYNSGESFVPSTNYQVRRVSDDASVFSADIVVWHGGDEDAQSGDKAWTFDFSTVDQAGEYYIFDLTNNVKSYDFVIEQDVYHNVLKQALRAFFYQRCGTSKLAPMAEGGWTDTDCHLGTNQDLACKLVTDANNGATAKDLSGGWHDAGDFNKYVNFTFDPMHDLLAAYEENPSVWGGDMNIPESGNGTPDILDEIKWELDWLLKMQETDGSVLMKVSVTDYQSASPPSSDSAERYYGQAQSSATRVACGIFAHAAIVYQNIDATFANTLKTKAELAWTWLQNNPGYSDYDNSGFSSANPERSHDDQDAISFTAAVYLFVLTGNATYRDYVDDHYSEIHAIAWTFWFPFESTYQDALLYYAASSNGTTSVKDAILDNYRTSVKTNNSELLPAYQSFSTPYRAYISTDNYVWGSSGIKAHSSLLFYRMIPYGNDPANNEVYQNAAENFVHYMHGINPQNIVYLSNMNNHGAEKSCNEIYHAWFDDGTVFDNAQTSTYGPAPGFVPGGPNKNFDPPTTTTISPPEGQPAQKAYKDWNTTYPENSWEITEPANGYQAAYILMLSKFLEPSQPLPIVTLEPLRATWKNNQVLLTWATASEINNVGFEIESSEDGVHFSKVGFVAAKEHLLSENHYQVLVLPLGFKSYFRYKQIDLDGQYEYSNIVFLDRQETSAFVFPNPTEDLFYVDLHLGNEGHASMQVTNLIGQNILLKDLGYWRKGHHRLVQKIQWTEGVYYVKIVVANQVVFSRALVVE